MCMCVSSAACVEAHCLFVAIVKVEGGGVAGEGVRRGSDSDSEWLLFV